MPGSILLLTDGVTVRDEAFRYATGLAARTEASLVVLIALPVEAADAAPSATDWAARLEAAVRRELGGYEAVAREAGVEVEAVLRLGDQPSEVLKYLAGRLDVRSVVWGGSQNVNLRPAAASSTHWLARIERAVDCPLVLPAPRSPESTGR
jgi:hypothetical protein